MKKLLFFCFIAASLIGCQPNYTEVIQTLHEDGSRRLVYYYNVHNNDSTLAMLREYYPSSPIIRIEGSFKNNERDGLWKSWREDGKLWSEGEFKAGIRDGITKVYHENGALYYSGNYKDGQRIGTWKFFNEEGKMIKEVKYE
ncbi:MAG: hypothetical protein PHR53_02710 [Bacteroidales bacterium]|nr:hypothetical protein [Bacteroidales bacterium]